MSVQAALAHIEAQIKKACEGHIGDPVTPAVIEKLKADAADAMQHAFNVEVVDVTAGPVLPDRVLVSVRARVIPAAG